MNLRVVIAYSHPCFFYLLITTGADENSYREHVREKLGKKKESQIELKFEKIVIFS